MDTEENFLKEYEIFCENEESTKLKSKELIQEQTVPNISVKFFIKLNIKLHKLTCLSIFYNFLRKMKF